MHGAPYVLSVSYTHLFAASDPIAIGAMRALYQKGYRIPEDISVIGFDDINVAKFSNPPLTTKMCIRDRMRLSTPAESPHQ